MDTAFEAWQAAAARVVGCDPEEVVEQLTVRGDDGLSIRPVYTSHDGVEPVAVPLSKSTGVCLEISDPATTSIPTEGVDAFWFRGGADAETVDRMVADYPDLTMLFDDSGVLGSEPFVLDGNAVHDRGANAVLELAIICSTLVAHLRALPDAALTFDTAPHRIWVRVAVTQEQFPSIAKLRALRVVLAQIAAACGRSRDVHVHAVTSAPMLTVVDPWVNILRTTVASFAAIVGGADLLTVRPCDYALVDPVPGLDRGAAARLAWLISHVLTGEAGLAAVADPTRGSWYVEDYTRSLAAAAWECFQTLEAAGGLPAAYATGLVDELLERARRRRDVAIETGERVITAVTSYPDRTNPPLAARDNGVHRYAAAAESRLNA